MSLSSAAHKEAKPTMTSPNEDITLTLSTKHWLPHENRLPPNWGNNAVHQVCECSDQGIMSPVPLQHTLKSPGTQLIISRDAGL